MVKDNSYVARVHFVLLILVFLLAGRVPSAWAAAKVGFVDIQKAVSETREFKRALAQFNKDFQKEKGIIAAREKKIKGMLDEINKQSFVLSPDRKKKKEEEFLQEKKDFERYVQDKNDEFARKEKEITDAILKKMLKVITTLGKKKNYTMIIEKKAVFYSDSAADITSLATKTYDRTYR